MKMRVRPDREAATGARRAAWTRPKLHRLLAGKAEILAATSNDGVSTQS